MGGGVAARGAHTYSPYPGMRVSVMVHNKMMFLYRHLFLLAFIVCSYPSQDGFGS